MVPTADPVWFEPRSDPWSGEFLRRLASLATATPFGTAWLVARRSDLPGVVVVPGGSVAQEVVEAAASTVPGRLVRVGPAVFGTPMARDRFGVVVRTSWGTAPVERTAASDPPGRSPPDPPEIEFPNGDDTGTSARQCHWFSTGTGRLASRVRLRVRVGNGPAPGLLHRSAADIVTRLRSEGVQVAVRELANTSRRRRAWTTGRVGSFAAGPLERLRHAAAAEIALGPPPAITVDDAAVGRHVVVVGASGSGKSTLLAELAADRIRRGRSVVAIDVHGDLGPSIAARLPPTALARMLAIDAGADLPVLAGVRLLTGGADPAARERESAHLVAALKRLTGEGGDVYWGFRLERTLDVFVRLVQEEGGGLADLHALLTDPRRRDAARLATHLPAAAAFLDELPVLLRRNPEFLAPAAARVAKVALTPKLVRLLDPVGAGVPVVEVLSEGRSIVWRLPFAELGPEAAGFAATLLATHVYLALAAHGTSEPGALRVALVVDEASALSPRLVSEVLSEGRKFGVGMLLATQYPARLAPEARSAAEGAAGTHVVFRVPAPVAAATVGWLGLDRSLERVLETLPDGTALVARSGDSGGRGAIRVPPPPPDGRAAWDACVRATAQEFGEFDAGGTTPLGEVDDAVTFALAAGPADLAAIAERLAAMSEIAIDPATLGPTLGRLVERGWLRRESERYDLTAAGARYLGVGAPTGAANEGAEHRALLYTAFGIFARKGARLELVRQGRFDRRLPDAVVRLLPPSADRPPSEWARLVDAARGSWAWRFFRGRDVDVEAEVSGAVRPDRIRRNLQKARDRGTFALFVVGDAVRARRIRGVLESEGAGRSEAQVWTLRRARPAAQAAGGAASGGSAVSAASVARGRDNAPERC
ncbi:MAG: DUF87 domain-containing protein [Thermoplasmata archaeon]|nr:DUF87 domain-containing protein [Thermoplasmata archaeon]